MLGTTISAASGLLVGNALPAAGPGSGQTADPRIRGPFPILSTPFTESGAVDYEVLANQARFVDWGGCPGMIWPLSGDSVDLLTMEEKLRGMEVLAETSRGLRSLRLTSALRSLRDRLPLMGDRWCRSQIASAAGAALRASRGRLSRSTRFAQPPAIC
jgi:hypothetical protein